MPKKRMLVKRDELKKPDKVPFSCRECGCEELRGIYIVKAYINVENEDGSVTKEQVKKRYRDCQKCGTRYATFESIIYKVNRKNVQIKGKKGKGQK